MARILDGLKSCGVFLHGQALRLWDVEVCCQEAGFVHAQGVPRSLQADGAGLQFRDDDLAEPASTPLPGRNRAVPLEDVIPEDLPEARLDGCPGVKQRKGAVGMGKPVVREPPELIWGRTRSMHPEPTALRLPGNGNRPLIEIRSGLQLRPRRVRTTRHTLGQLGRLPSLCLCGASPRAAGGRGCLSPARRRESSPTRRGARPG